MENKTTVTFAPQLYIPHGTMELDFYKQAFNAVELRRFGNEDGSIHVSEMTIGGALFHFHEENETKGTVPPARHNSVTTIIGLFVPDVDAVMQQALAAGATLRSPARDYDYGYRQGEIKDPLGHHWLIEKVI